VTSTAIVQYALRLLLNVLKIFLRSPSWFG